MPDDTAAYAEPSNENQETTPDEFFVSKYRDKEQAEAGIVEKDRFIAQTLSERDQARQEADKLRDEAITRLVEAQSRPTGPSPSEEAAYQERRVQALVDDLADAQKSDEQTSARKTLEIISAYHADAEQSNAAAVAQAKEELLSTLGQELSAVKSTLAAQSPDMVKYGSKAKDLAESVGANFDNEEVKNAFIGVVKKTQSTEHPERHDLPGGSDRTRPAISEPEQLVTDYDKSFMASVGIRPPSPEEEALLARMSRRQETR